MKLIPLTSRLPQTRENGLFEGVSALIGENDRLFVDNVLDTLYNTFDTYLGGEIVEDAINNIPKPYSRIDLFAVPWSRLGKSEYDETNRQRFVDLLEHSKNCMGSDQWVHFGMVTSSRVGFGIKDHYHGDYFYADLANSSTNSSEFILSPAIYESSRGEPSPIHLFLVSSLEGFDVLL